MAVNSIVFGGIDSADYDIYISGEGVFNAPKRDVEMIEIPGRNGAFALDKGRFENIEVTYPAFNFEPGDYNTFAKNLSDFRNAICSLKGYQRLTDSFHPNEYRMAVYRDGLEVKPIKYNTASEFEITFDCKPQRWLTSGETKQTIANSGDTITNPTLFASAPLLEVEGDGDITINNSVISIENVPLGDVLVYGGYTSTATTGSTTHITFEMDLSRLNVGDTITLSGVQLKNVYTVASYWDSTVAIREITISETTNMASSSKGISSARTAYVNYTPNPFTFYKGTSATSTSSSIKVYVKQWGSSLTPYDETRTFTYYATYDGNDTIDVYFSKSAGSPSNLFSVSLQVIVPEIMGDSTLSTLPTPVYIDLDIGEAYGDYSGVIASVNNAVILPAELPTLAPGSNEIAFDNTITDLKVVPRWWRV